MNLGDLGQGFFLGREACALNGKSAPTNGHCQRSVSMLCVYQKRWALIR
jgi:hypothetical protein